MTEATGGKRAGSRRGPRRKARFQPALLLMALGITACVVAWGYLVVAAVDFGSTARGGDDTAWWFLALASVGAVACLFVGLMLVARVLRRIGLTQGASGRPAAGDHGGEHPGQHVDGHHSGHHAGHHPGHHGEHRGEHHTGTHTDGDPDRPRPVGGRRAAR